MIKSWVTIFENTVSENFNKTAVVGRDYSLSFGDLRGKSLKIANIICTNTSCENKPIVVLLPKCPEVICADLGIYYSHNVFSNLDIKTPTQRLNNTIELLKPCGIISTSQYIKNIQVPSGVFIIELDNINLETGEVLSDGCVQRLLLNQVDTDPFCIINTSGSTGTPKGVVLNHRSFFDFMDWSLETFQIADDEIIGSLSPVVFDIYEYELCLMMKKSATIVQLDSDMAAFPAKLLQDMEQKNITFLFWVPTIMVNIANMDLLSRIPLPTIRTVWFAGEVFPTKQFNYWKKQMPSAVFANLYGPIEITLDCIYYIVDRDFKDDDVLPIGIPCNNTDILLLNEDNKLCEYNEKGEICVRGTSLAMGYYNNPEKTAMAFTQNPLNTSYPEIIYRTGDIAYKNDKDGLIYFVGRKDSLIKHMGYRIEMGEIEHVLVNDLKIVKNCCAVYDYEKKQIVLYYEGGSGDKRYIQRELCKSLPRYMVPTVWIELDELPRNTNGKIDRLYLSNEINQ